MNVYGVQYLVDNSSLAFLMADVDRNLVGAGGGWEMPFGWEDNLEP